MNPPGLLRRLAVLVMGLLAVLVFLQQAHQKEQRRAGTVQSFTADVALKAIIAVRYGPVSVPQAGVIVQSLDATAYQAYLLLTPPPKPDEQVRAEQAEIPYLRLAALHLVMGRPNRAQGVLAEASRTVGRRSRWQAAALLEAALTQHNAEAGQDFFRWQREHEPGLTGLLLGREAALAIGDEGSASEYARLLEEHSAGVIHLLVSLTTGWLVSLSLGLLAWVWILARWRKSGWAGMGRSARLGGGVWSAFEVVLVLIFSQILVALGLGLILRALPGGMAPTMQPHEFVALLTGTYIGAAILTAIYVLNVMYPWQEVRAADVGLTPTTGGRTFGWGLAWMFALLLAVQLIGAAWVRLVHGEPLWHPVMEALAAHPPGWAMVSLLLLGVVVAPFVEEVVFRGYVYPRFRVRLRAASAMLLNGLLFASLHASAVAFLPVVALGVGLCALYEKSGSVWPCVVCHGTFNAVQFAGLLGAMAIAAA